MNVKTEPAAPHDVIRWEVDYRFTRRASLFNNDAGDDTDEFAIGLVCEALDATHYIALTTAANADSILLTNIKELATDANAEAVFLVRGPALVDYDALNFNGKTAATAWAALNVLGIQALSEPASGVTSELAS